MKNTHVVKKRPKVPVKDRTASDVKRLDHRSSPVIKRISSENTSQVIIKGDTVALKRRKMRVSETIDLSDPRAKQLLSEWFPVEDPEELEEVA